MTTPTRSRNALRNLHSFLTEKGKPGATIQSVNLQTAEFYSATEPPAVGEKIKLHLSFELMPNGGPPSPYFQSAFDATVRRMTNSSFRHWLTMQPETRKFLTLTETNLHRLPTCSGLAQELQAQASREGASNEKAYALAAVSDAAFEISAAVHAYAVTTQDYALEGRVDFSRSTIRYGREASVLARVRDIHAAATAELANLADYGVTQAKLTALKKKMDAFEAVLAKPRQQIATGSAATQSLQGKFNEADAILNKRLDKLVFQFKTSAPDFFTTYQTAHNIVSLRGSRKTNETPVPAPQPA
jgi:hypothetical protein